MKVVWSDNAKASYFRTLGYWIKHNGSRTYSDKITEAVNLLLYELEQKPYFLAKYSESLNLYRPYYYERKVCCLLQHRRAEWYHHHHTL